MIVIQFVLLPFLVQTPRELGRTYGLGRTAEQMANITSPAGLISVLAGFAVGWIAQRRGAWLPNLTGFCTMTVGSAMLALQHDTFAQVLVGYVVFAFGGGLVSATVPLLVIAAVPAERQAVSAATVTVVGGLAATVAVQVTFAVLAVETMTVVRGQAVYVERGFVVVYLVAAAMALAGVVTGVVMRHGRRPQSAEA